MRYTNRSKQKRRTPPRHATPDSSPRHLLQHFAQSMLASLAVGGALILIASLALSFSPDPNVLLQPVGLLCAALTAFLGGWITSYRHGHAALLCGSLHGMLLCGMMLLASLLFAGNAATYASSYNALVSALLHVGVILLSIAGAYLAMKKKPQKHRRRR